MVIIKQLFQFKEYSKDNYTLKYRKYQPNIIEGEKLPLIIFLHGAGERGSDNILQLKKCIAEPFKNANSNFYNSIVIAPQCPGRGAQAGQLDYQWVKTNWNYGNYNLAQVEESKHLKTVYSLIEEYKKCSYIDTDRIYVVGVSMGGFGAWDLLARHSDTFAGGIIMCGGGPVDMAETLSNVPIYVFHGSNDVTVPYSASVEMVNQIKSYNKNLIHFKTWNGATHGIWNQSIVFTGDAENVDNPGVEEWLFSQSKR